MGVPLLRVPGIFVDGNCMHGGGFKDFLFLPRSLGK